MLADSPENPDLRASAGAPGAVPHPGHRPRCATAAPCGASGGNSGPAAAHTPRGAAGVGLLRSAPRRPRSRALPSASGDAPRGGPVACRDTSPRGRRPRLRGCGGADEGPGLGAAAVEGRPARTQVLIRALCILGAPFSSRSTPKPPPRQPRKRGAASRGSSRPLGGTGRAPFPPGTVALRLRGERRRPGRALPAPHPPQRRLRSLCESAAPKASRLPQTEFSDCFVRLPGLRPRPGWARSVLPAELRFFNADRDVLLMVLSQFLRR
ncbi:translation initiation factor IF-2-like [Leopardus geoffroyi]|uniref:translation initiation factor IF-2-like n=1 Tax=Leopardus geoffroyi TaxID=46844 RepID=UPI001E2661B6|nr:translation initiation factor IF-2-like [Leopardus geoffroyi]